MNQDVAELIVRIGTISAWCVWMITVWFFRKMSRREPVIHKEIATTQQPAGARKTVLRALAAQPQWRIIERTQETITAVALRIRISITLREVLAGTQCRIALDFRRIDRSFVLWMRLILFGMAPLALLGVPELLRRFVVTSSVSGIQWQAVQIVQLVHVLWPPFLLYAVHTQLRGYGIRLADQLALLLEIES